MISKSFSIVMCLMWVQSGLVLSVEEQVPSDLKESTQTSSISLSEFLATFRRLHHDTIETQLSVMFMVASYGDQFYNLSADLSAECWRTARANSLMLGKLAHCEEAFDVMYAAVSDVVKDLRNRTELKEHPLELVCSRLQRGYAEKTNLRGAFEKAKEDAANFKVSSPRPAYSREFLKPEEFYVKVVEKWEVPEVAKLMVLVSVHSLLHAHYYGESIRPTLFIKSCRAVAREEKFAESMQKVFEKAISDVLPELMAKDRVEKFMSALKSQQSRGDMWWISAFLKDFHAEIAKDPILKKEVDDKAVSVGIKASKEDLDFSKL